METNHNNQHSPIIRIPTMAELQVRTNTPNYAISLANPTNFYAELPVRSVAEHFTNSSLSLQQIAKIDEIGIFKIQALLNIILVDLVLFFEVGKTMGADQIKQTVQLVLEDYSHLKPEDFKLCFNRLKKGYYGKLYDRLDGQIILDCLGQYDNERTGEIESIRAKENREYKKLSAAPLLPTAEIKPDDEVFNRNMKILKDNLAEAKKQREQSKPVEVRKPDPVYEMHQRWMRNFSDIYTLRPVGKGIRIIKRYGKMLDINGYMEHKQYQYSLAIIRAENARNAQ